MSPTPLPQVVGVPTPTPFASNLGTFISRLSSGEALDGELNDVSQSHVYTFEGTAGQFVTVEMVRVSGTIDPFLTLYSPNGVEVAADDNSGGGKAALLRNIRLPDNGLYTVQATGDSFLGGYRLSFVSGSNRQPVTPDLANPQRTSTPIKEVLTPTIAPAVSGNRLEDHIPVIGALAREGDFNRFPIFAASGEAITIGASPLPGTPLSLKLEVYGPAGDLVASATSSTSKASGDALVSPLRVETTGAYVVFVTAEDGKSIGQYTISYGSGSTRQNVMRGTALENRPNAGEIARRGLQDVWSLVLNAGDVITAAVSPDDSTLDPILELVAADGALVAVDDNSGGGRNALIAYAPIPVSGLYHLRVKAAQASGIGAYTLVWRYINLAPTNTPAPGTITLMSIDGVVPDNTYLFYPFQGEAGQRVEIRVDGQPASSFDPVAALLDPGGKVIAQADDGDNGSLYPRFVVQLPGDGTYTVRVNGYIKGGPFELTVKALY
jgi:hypothetical protein